MRNYLSKVKNKIIDVFWLIVNFPTLMKKNVRCGQGLRLRGKVHVVSRGNINIGNDVTINSSVKANPLGGSTCSTLVALNDATIDIGSHSGISNTCIFAREKIVIEDYVMLGAGVKIYDNDFHPVDYEARVKNEIPMSRPITIKSGAFVGAHSIVLKGVTIGNKSVVGAGSVVTKSIPDNQVWAGNPAKFIRDLGV